MPLDERTRNGRIVVVGHDGSAPASEALARAAQRAGYLIVVHALGADSSGAAGYADAAARLLRSIDDAVAADVRYEARIVAGPESHALLEVAGRYRADEIVFSAA